MTVGLAGLELPAEWQWWPLKHAARAVNRGSAPDYVDDGPVWAVSQAVNQPHRLDWDRARFHGGSRAAGLKGLLAPDDILINSTGRGTLGRVGYFTGSPDDRPAMADGHVTQVRTKTQVLHPRFAFYYFSSEPFQHYIYSALIVGATNQIELVGERLDSAPVVLPPLAEQLRIAAFLDGRLKRLDSLRDAIRLRITRSIERRLSHFQEVVKRYGGPDMTTLDLRDNGEWKANPLSKVLDQLTNGYVGPTRDLLVDDGVRYLQSLHIKKGSIDFERRPYFVPGTWLDQRSRIKLRVGDLLLVQTGALGEVALVDDHYAGSGCHALLIARPKSSRVSSEYLWCLFRSSWGKEALLREQTGALHPHLEAGKVREIVVPIPPLGVQDAIVKECTKYADAALGIEETSERQLILLEERRQALITAAVTGQIDVTTARRCELT